MEVNQETNDTSGKNASNEKDGKPSFGTRQNTKNPDFDLKKKLERLPFELNIGDAPLTREQSTSACTRIHIHSEIGKENKACISKSYNLLIFTINPPPQRMK